MITKPLKPLHMTRQDECDKCHGTNWFHNLDCPRPSKVISEKDEPQEMKLEMINGRIMKIQRVLTLLCYRCSRLRTFLKINTSEDTKKFGIGFKKGEICYRCYYCNQPGVVELIPENHKKLKEALKVEAL